MAIQIAFANAGLAGRTANNDALDRRWGGDAHDVRMALSVLAACDDISVFLLLPNVTKEGELIVFEGDQVDVVLDLANTDGPYDVVISDLEVRP